MLLEFKCKNFRSFKNEGVLSMLPVKAYKEKRDNIIHAELENQRTLDVLAAVAIYGPNASGKSNFLNAIRFAKTFITSDSALDSLNNKSFIDNDNENTEFSFYLLINKVRYLYEFALSNYGVVYERLSAKPKTERLVFERKITDDGLYKFKAGSKYSGIKTKLRGYMDTGLVLELLSKFNIDDCKMVFNWFANDLQIDIGNDLFDYNLMLNKLADLSEDSFEKTMSKVKSADLGITGAQLAVRNLTEEERNKNRIISDQVKTIFKVLSGKEPDNIQEPDKKIIFQFQHSIGGKRVGFGYENESLGTLMVLNLAIDFIDALSNGKTLIIDEIERSVHPMLLVDLISMFFNQNLNTKGAQLVFTTHNLTFMNLETMRRDQLWYVDKDDDSGASEIYSLSDFSPRKDDSIINRYKYGAYGAVPFLQEEL